MEYLKKKILKEGEVRNGNILKVDSFLNHQLDVETINEIGKEFKKRFEHEKIDKILTIEASGIAIAIITAQYFKVPVVFAKKMKGKNMNEEVFETEVYSYTKDISYNICVSKRYIKENENILIIDDFLANGAAALGLIDIVKQGKAIVSGVGIVIEKSFQSGGKKIQEKGVKLESLVKVRFDNDRKVIFD